jgi:type VI protein secretion system component Hcp
MSIHMTFTVNGNTMNLGKGQVLSMSCAGAAVTPMNLASLGSRMAAQSHGATHRVAGKPVLQSLVFQREMDSASPSLIARLGKHKLWPSLHLNLVQENAHGIEVPFATLTMTNAALAASAMAQGASQPSWSGSDGDMACKEEVTFEYGALQVRYLGGAPTTGDWGPRKIRIK